MFTKMIKKNSFFYVGLFVAAVMVVVACSKSTDMNSKGTTKMNIYLTDAPASYQAVWINIQKVMVKASDDTASEGWTEIPLIAPGLYNLLDLRNGKDTLLGGVDLPVGKVSQIRLVLGDGNKVILNDGTEVLLKTPSAQESGLKLNIDADLVEGIPYELVMDFDAAKSVVKAGNSGNYNLKPVIRTFAKATGGAIQGVVLPDTALAVVFAINGMDTLTAIPDTSGAFKFWGLNAGAYTVTALPDTSTMYQPVTIDNVQVTSGEVNVMDTIRLMK